MKKIFTLYNLILFICFAASLALAIAFSSLFSWLIFISVMAGIISAMLTSKGKWQTFIFDIISYALYIYVCFVEKYYGELALSVIVILMHISSLFVWKRNQIKKVVKVNKVTSKEIFVVFSVFLILFIAYVVALYFLKTELPILNALSTMVFLIGNYFCFRRSAIHFFCFIAYELLFIALWCISACSGSMGSIIFLVGAVGELIFEIFGIFRWRKLKNEQNLAVSE